MSQPETAAGRLDLVFDALRQRHRRRILTAIGGIRPGTDAEIDLGDLVADEHDGDRRLLELSHVHLPKLEAAGYVTVVRDGRAIRRGPRFEEVSSVLRLVQDHRHDLGL